MIHTPETAREAMREIVSRMHAKQPARRIYTDEYWAKQLAAALLKAQADALEEAVLWHWQRRAATPDTFEMEFHEVSATAIRALIPKGAS